ncbi:MAG: hypothetical protein RL091_608, partial [Verrucomicrobiota bacterium]
MQARPFVNSQLQISYGKTDGGLQKRAKESSANGRFIPSESAPFLEGVFARIKTALGHHGQKRFNPTLMGLDELRVDGNRQGPDKATGPGMVAEMVDYFQDTCPGALMGYHDPG